MEFIELLETVEFTDSMVNKLLVMLSVVCFSYWGFTYLYLPAIVGMLVVWFMVYRRANKSISNVQQKYTHKISGFEDLYFINNSSVLSELAFDTLPLNNIDGDRFYKIFSQVDDILYLRYKVLEGTESTKYDNFTFRVERVMNVIKSLYVTDDGSNKKIIDNLRQNMHNILSLVLKEMHSKLGGSNYPLKYSNIGI